MYVDTVERAWGPEQEAVRDRHRAKYPHLYKKEDSMSIHQHENFSTNSGVQGWSSPCTFSSYLIFCVGNDIARESAFRAWAAENGIGFKNLTGKYKGTTERSFIVNFDNYFLCSHWFKDQESVLYLSPLYRNKQLFGERLAVLFYINGPRKDLGKWRNVCKEYALKQDAWTYDIDADQYWVAEGGK